MAACAFALAACQQVRRQEAPAEPQPTSQEAAQLAAPRLVAVGDLHGDLQHSLAVLQLAGLLDERGRWIGGDSQLVQTGDLLDRGDDGKGVLDLMMRLQAEATAAGGAVHVLMGNHEAMNLLGDWRYVSQGDLASFGGEEARRAALSSEGDYGAWLAERDPVARVGETIFVHGGVRAQVAQGGLERINQAYHAALEGGGDASLLGEDGPTWYRGYLTEAEPAACAELGRALQALQARRMVVGHTTQRSGRIASRCEGALLAIDTGISEHYGAHAAALELRGDDAWALYPEGAQDLPDPVP